jgi:hypothetical protein
MRQGLRRRMAMWGAISSVMPSIEQIRRLTGTNFPYAIVSLVTPRDCFNSP